MALLNEFPRPTFDEWLAAADRELHGRSLDAFTWAPDPGIESPQLFTRRDLDGLPHLTAPGVANLLAPAAPWKIRQCIDAATPELAARLCEQAIAGGADELLIRLDEFGRHGIDPSILDDPDVDTDAIDFDPGEGGCAIYHLAALARVLVGVDLQKTRIALDAGAGSLAVLDMWRCLAIERGLPMNLEIELGLDPIGEMVHGQTLRTKWHAKGAWLHSEYAMPLAIHSAGYHQAGATAVQELACTLATAIEYLRWSTAFQDEATTRTIPIDRFVRSICLRLTVNTDIHAEIAKLRAARLLWAKVAHAFGASDLRATVHAESSDRSWSHDDVHTNLLRSNVQAFIAALAGCDSIMIAPFDTTHDEGDEQTRALARNQLILLREEAMLQRVQDPCGGSFAIEALTDRFARSAWGLVQEIEQRGGMTAALRDGFVQSRIADAGERRRVELRNGSRILVGTTRFADPRFRKKEMRLPDTESIWNVHRTYLTKRGPIEVLPAMSQTKAAGAGATISELTALARREGRVALERGLVSLAPETEGFESLRSMVLAADLAVLPILVGPEKLARAREVYARDIFTAGGFRVLDAVTPADAIDGDTAIVVLCGEERAVDELAPTLAGDFPLCVAGPPRAGLDAVFLFVGGDMLHALRELYLAVTSDPDQADDE